MTKIRTIRTPNVFTKYGKDIYISLFDKNSELVGRAIIDVSEFNKVSKYKWYLSKRGSVETRINDKLIKLHQFILGRKKGLEIDHINGNPLDNRKINLRHVTHHQNSMNSLGRGIHFVKRKNKWVAYIKYKYKRYHLGYFNKEKDALFARENAKTKFFGEFARVLS